MGLSEATIEVAVPQARGDFFIEAGSGAVPAVYLVRDGAAVVVGASDEADIKILDRAVSQRHCRIVAERGGLVVEDLSSKNGTYVGGARVGWAVLLPGATLIVGRTALTCHSSDDLAEPPAELLPLPGVVGTSIAMRRVIDQVWKLSRVRAPILFQGETGTGKDVLARALHAVGPRSKQPFVALNVGTLPREIADAELFGHERGAFTGAVTSRAGAFVEADGGTLFLDEIAELSLDMQVKLLRVLEDGEVRPIGGRTHRKVDVRIVSATWAPLAERAACGQFRQDLYQRLAVCVVDVPPLRARRSDLPDLCRCVLDSIADEVGAVELAPGALAKLASHSFVGNVRELRNVLYRAALHSSSRLVQASDIDASLAQVARPRPVQPSPEQARALVASVDGNVSAAARRLGVARSTFRDWLGSGGASDTVEAQNEPSTLRPA